MTIFQNALARIKEDDNPRLHRVPFTLIWMASYALAWFAMFFVSMIYDDLFNVALILDMAINHITRNYVISNLVIGLGFGITLSLIQTWLIRQRYGFVPRFWRATTIIGAMIVGTITPFFNYYDNSMRMWGAVFIWFSTINILQAVILFRVNRQSWILALIGIVAVIIGWIQYYDGEILGVLLGSLIQAFASGIITLHLMSNPREGIVPKRDSNEKAKTGLREGLHPMTFIGFWSATYFVAWLTIFIGTYLIWITFGQTSIGSELNVWTNENAGWLVGMIFGMIFGVTSAIMQGWLMKKQRIKVGALDWVAACMIGWSLAGIGFWKYTDGYSTSEVEKFTNLLIWFATPTLFQTIPMWRAMRGGWIWALTWLASAIIAYLIVNDGFYAIMLGGLAQAIITGSAFILLQSQQQRVERDAVSA